MLYGYDSASGGGGQWEIAHVKLVEEFLDGGGVAGQVFGGLRHRDFRAPGVSNKIDGANTTSAGVILEQGWFRYGAG